MTQGDEKYNDLTDEEFFALLEQQHGKAIADRARNVQRQRRYQVPKKVGVKTKRVVPKEKPTRKADEFDRMRHGDPPKRLLSNRNVKPRQR